MINVNSWLPQFFRVGLILTILVGLTACEGEFGTPPTVDTQPPTVSGVYPAPGATDVPLNVILRVAFDELVEGVSLGSTTFNINGVIGTVRVSGSTANLSPTNPSPLQPNNQYTATLKGGANGIKDVAGNALAGDYSWSFTTGTTIASTPCSDFYQPGFTLVSGQDVSLTPSVAKSAKGIPFTDPTYNTCIVRVSDAAAEAPSTFARNDYSRRQAFNADDSLILIYAFNGSWHIYDARTMAHVKQLVGVGGEPEPQWHPTNPDLIYSLPSFGGMVIRETNVRTDVQTVVADFTGRLPWPTAARVWTASEGSPSANARYWGFLVQDASYNYLGLMTYDMQTDTILGTFTNVGGNTDDPNNVSMSPSGKYIVAQFGNSERPLGPSQPGGPIAFTLDFSTYKHLRPNGLVGHTDIAIGANGDDVFVGDDHQSGHLFMTNLETGVSTNLYFFWQDCNYYAGHVSGKAFNKPGWIVVSTFDSPGCWSNDKIFVVELTANPRILHLAHHHTVFGSSSFNYFSQPHASTNRDLTRIVFNTNWETLDANGDGYTLIDTYMIEIPPGAIP